MLTDAGLGTEKKAMRAAAIARRKAAFAADAGARLAARFLAAHRLPPGTAVSAYWPMGSELDPRPLLHRLDADGHFCLLPVVVGRGQPLLFRRWRPESRLLEAGFKVMTPGPEAAEGVPSLVLCPLLAFDRRGYRLGYGGGYYDRTLRRLRRAGGVTAIGIGFAAQEVPEVPTDATDQRLDGILTEAGPIPLDPT
jgi:5-formyltetrahydrofolate cyclo-ligase